MTIYSDDEDDYSLPPTHSYNQHQQAFISRGVFTESALRNTDSAALFPTGNSFAMHSATNSISSTPHNNMIPTSAVGPRFQQVFPFACFNGIQSECFNIAFQQTDHLVVSAPTGAGKTVLMELCILQQLQQQQQSQHESPLMIYLAPTKSLCSERHRDWQTKFRNLNVNCVEVTGDTDGYLDLRRVDLLVTTPEKLDVLTRRSGDLEQRIKLLMIDEVHLLNESRGATLEVVISRLKASRRSGQTRFIAISATIPNIADICEWLGAGPSLINGTSRKASKSSTSTGTCGSRCQLKQFGEEYRAVRLERLVLGYPQAGNATSSFQFDYSLNDKLGALIQQHSCGKPTLVFCNTRKSTVAACESLAKQNCGFPPCQIDNNGQQLQFKDRKLAELVRFGVAFHHAGLVYADRLLIERLFIAGRLRVICTTSTLACGVNLPAHLVIIKSTEMYDGPNGFTEYSELDVLQMIGRAGRPQFDDSGKAVIMTSMDKVQRYQSLLSGTQLIESCLHRHLVEHLNAEIQLRTITDPISAVCWLKTTFLYVRLRHNPSYYGLAPRLSAAQLDVELEQWCRDELAKLRQAGCIDFRPDGSLQTLSLGATMSKYYVRFETIALQSAQLPPKGTPAMLLNLACQASEFSGTVRFQPGDKPVLNKLAGQLRYSLPSGGRISTIADKVYVLIQSTLGDLSFQDAKVGALLEAESRRIIRDSPRIFACLVELCKLRQDGIGLQRSVELLKCIKAQRWDDPDKHPQFIIRQLDKIGPVMAGQLVSAGFRSLAAIQQADPRRLEMIVGRNPPFGNQLIESAQRLPRFQLEVMQYQEYKSSDRNSCELFITIRLENAGKCRPAVRSSPVYVACCCYRSDGLLLDFRRLPVGKLIDASNDPRQPSQRQFSIKAQFDSPGQQAHCFLICENFIGLDQQFTISPTHISSYSCSTSNSMESNNNNTIQLASCETPANQSCQPPKKRQKVQTKIKIHPNGSVKATAPQLPPQPPPQPTPAKTVLLASNTATSFFADGYEAVVEDEIMVLTPPQTILTIDSTPPKKVDTSSKFFAAKDSASNDNDLLGCNHKCKDKQACGHLCCKTGRRSKQRPKLASIKRSLIKVDDAPPIVFDDAIAVSTPKPSGSLGSDDLLAELAEKVDLQRIGDDGYYAKRTAVDSRSINRKRSQIRPLADDIPLITNDLASDPVDQLSDNPNQRTLDPSPADPESPLKQANYKTIHQNIKSAKSPQNNPLNVNLDFINAFYWDV